MGLGALAEPPCSIMTIDIAYFLPAPPLWRLDWDGIDAAYPWIRKLRGSTQDPVHHAEGDVWTHVGMVTAELTSHPEWRASPPGKRLVVFAAALLHDVCKPETRRVEDGRITNRGHSRMGANEARQILWRMGWPLAEREQVCAIIKVHQAPFWLLERSAWEASRILTETSLSVPNRLLAMLAQADARGRICADWQRIVDAVELFREAARDMGCYDEAFAFANDHARFRYFQDPQSRRPDSLVWDDTDPAFTVTVMSGLPAMGKSTWIRTQTAPGATLAGQAMISLDAMREEMDVDPADNQGQLIQDARERARVLLRGRQPFVWDATNLGRSMRGQTIRLAADYGARIRVAYIEAPERAMLERNASRDGNQVPVQVMARMLRHWEVPTLAECHSLTLGTVDN